MDLLPRVKDPGNKSLGYVSTKENSLCIHVPLSTLILSCSIREVAMICRFSQALLKQVGGLISMPRIDMPP